MWGIVYISPPVSLSESWFPSVKTNFDYKLTTWVSRSSQQSDTDPDLLSRSPWIRWGTAYRVVLVTVLYSKALLACTWLAFKSLSLSLTSKLPAVNRLKHEAANEIKSVISVKFNIKWEYAVPACFNMKLNISGFDIHTQWDLFPAQVACTFVCVWIISEPWLTQA